MVCKLSIVIPGSPHSGAIINTTTLPQVGDYLPIGDTMLEVMEIKELLPSSGNFHFVHVTCREAGGRTLPGDEKATKDE